MRGSRKRAPVPRPEVWNHCLVRADARAPAGTNTMLLKGNGVCSTGDAPFAGFLSDQGCAPDDSRALVARNFLLDESVPVARFESYRDAGAVGAHADYAAWLDTHNAYLNERVFALSHDHGPPAQVDLADADACPETFRLPAPSAFRDASPTLDLLRVETVTFVAKTSGREPSAVLDLARKALASPASDGARAGFDALLEVWSRALDTRPVFAAFWEDLADLFGARPADDAPDWADRLRDRLGLLHHDPADKRAPIDVLVFRYGVDALPPLSAGHGGGRVLLPPTVLDGRHSAAFCPAPRESATGHTLDLAAARARPCRELLHPCTRFRARHLLRVGTIREPATRDHLRAARGLHLLAVRELARRPDYAAGTDGDLT